MNSFLEYVCRRLMGPPVSGSCWRCPYCDSSHGSLSVRPPKVNPVTGEEYPVKFRCFRCSAWGDEHDLMKLFHPLWDFTIRRLQLADMRARYEANTAINDATNHYRGTGSTKVVSNDEYDAAEPFGAVAMAVVKDVDKYLETQPLGLADIWRVFEMFAKVIRIAESHGLSLPALAERCESETWTREHDTRHMTECDEPQCDHACCRLARGWSEENIRADVERRQRKRLSEKFGSLEEYERQRAWKERVLARACRTGGTNC